MAVEAAAAVQTLAREGIACTHAVVANLNPAPVEALSQLLDGFAAVVTVEAHYARGGLFSLIAETLAETGKSLKVARCAIEIMPDGEVGALPYMLDKYGLSASHIAEKVRGVATPGMVPCRTR
jgi:transketolase C-terminal domain/subunit